MSAHAAPARREKTKRWRVRGILLAVLIGLVGIAVVLGASGRYQVRPVLSGSMRPGLPVGGVVITQRVPLRDIKVRDVIVFTRPNDRSQLVVHRVIKLSRTGGTVTVKTQGDANNTPDPWTLSLHGSTAYRAIFSLPLIGYPAVWLQNIGGRGLLLIGAGIAVIIAMVAAWRRERREVADTNDEPAAGDGESAPSEGAEQDARRDAEQVIAANR